MCFFLGFGCGRELMCISYYANFKPPHQSFRHRKQSSPEPTTLTNTSHARTLARTRTPNRSINAPQILGNSVSHGRGDAITTLGQHVLIANNLLSTGAAPHIYASPLHTTLSLFVFRRHIRVRTSPPDRYPRGPAHTDTLFYHSDVQNVSAGISVDGSIDVTIASNKLRGFNRGIAVTNKDRIHIRGNTIAVGGDHPGGMVGIWVGESCDHVVVSSNLVSGTKGRECVSIEGAATATRITRNNECW